MVNAEAAEACRQMISRRIVFIMGLLLLCTSLQSSRTRDQGSSRHCAHSPRSSSFLTARCPEELRHPLLSHPSIRDNQYVDHPASELGHGVISVHFVGRSPTTGI